MCKNRKVEIYITYIQLKFKYTDEINASFKPLLFFFYKKSDVLENTL